MDHPTEFCFQGPLLVMIGQTDPQTCAEIVGAVCGMADHTTQACKDSCQPALDSLEACMKSLSPSEFVASMQVESSAGKCPTEYNCDSMATKSGSSIAAKGCGLALLGTALMML